MGVASIWTSPANSVTLVWVSPRLTPPVAELGVVRRHSHTLPTVTIWIKKPGTTDFLGPYTREEALKQLIAGTFTADYEALEATAQSFGDSRSRS